MRMRPLFSVFVAGMLVLTMALVACDDDDDNGDDGLNGIGDETPLTGETPDDGESPTTGETPAGADETPTETEGSDQPGDGQTIQISSDATGDALTVSSGDSVTFVNDTDESMTVTIENADGEVVSEEEVEAGEEFEYTFDEAGNYVVTTDAVPDFQADISVS